MSEPKEGTWGFRIREARRSKGLAAKTLAEILGVAPSEISKWEHNKLRPKTYLKSLADELGLEVEFITTGSREFKYDIHSPSIDVSGVWMTHFVTRSSRAKGEVDHLTIELIKPDKGSFRGESIAYASSKRSVNYKHYFEIRLKDGFAVIMWTNIITNHFGVGLLNINRSISVMDGQFLGMSSNNVVNNGPWVWCKLHVSNDKSFEDFANVFEDHSIEYWKDAIHKGDVTLQPL